MSFQPATSSSTFDNPCYTIPLASGDGANLYGDLNAKYYMMYYKVDPRYQLILLSAFPNARYYSVALYDEHSALTQTMLDANIVPLTSKYVNPFLPGCSLRGWAGIRAAGLFWRRPGNLGNRLYGEQLQRPSQLSGRHPAARRDGLE